MDRKAILQELDKWIDDFTKTVDRTGRYAIAALEDFRSWLESQQVPEPSALVQTAREFATMIERAAAPERDVGVKLLRDLADALEAAESRLAAEREKVRVLESRLHPWYGPCDGMADGECAECLAIQKRSSWLGEPILEIRRLEEKVRVLTTLVGDAQDFLKHLIAGKSQYYFGDKLMANGMAHAKELDQHLRTALEATHERG